MTTMSNLAREEDVANVARGSPVDRVYDRIDVPLAQAERVLAVQNRPEPDLDPSGQRVPETQPVVPTTPDEAALVHPRVERQRPLAVGEALPGPAAKPNRLERAHHGLLTRTMISVPTATTVPGALRGWLYRKRVWYPAASMLPDGDADTSPAILRGTI